MPRWPEGYVTQSVCPGCGGKKSRGAKLCRPCSPRPVGLTGRKGSDHPCWKGGRMVDKDGYIRLYLPDHPWPRNSGYVMEHVAIIELELGRRMLPGESVHHKDHNRQNNRRENLEVMSRSEHSTLHRKQDVASRKRDALGRFTSG